MMEQLNETKSVVSSVKMPVAVQAWHSLSGNSFTLTAGTWNLTGVCYFTNNGDTPPYPAMYCVNGEANGNDTTKTPVSLSTVGTLIGGGSGVLWNLASGSLNRYYMQSNATQFKCANIYTFYLNASAVLANPTYRGISVNVQARRIR